MISNLISAFLISLAASVILGLIIVPALRRAKAGQSIKEDGPVWHMSKQGTPTMGGIIFILGIPACPQDRSLYFSLWRQ